MIRPAKLAHIAKTYKSKILSQTPAPRMQLYRDALGWTRGLGPEVCELEIAGGRGQPFHSRA